MMMDPANQRQFETNLLRAIYGDDGDDDIPEFPENTGPLDSTIIPAPAGEDIPHPMELIIEPAPIPWEAPDTNANSVDGIESVKIWLARDEEQFGPTLQATILPLSTLFDLRQTVESPVFDELYEPLDYSIRFCNWSKAMLQQKTIMLITAAGSPAYSQGKTWTLMSNATEYLLAKYSPDAIVVPAASPLGEKVISGLTERCDVPTENIKAVGMSDEFAEKKVYVVVSSDLHYPLNDLQKITPWDGLEEDPAYDGIALYHIPISRESLGLQALCNVGIIENFRKPPISGVQSCISGGEAPYHNRCIDATLVRVDCSFLNEETIYFIDTYSNPKLRLGPALRSIFACKENTEMMLDAQAKCYNMIIFDNENGRWFSTEELTDLYKKHLSLIPSEHPFILTVNFKYSAPLLAVRDEMGYVHSGGFGEEDVVVLLITPPTPKGA